MSSEEGFVTNTRGRKKTFQDSMKMNIRVEIKPGKVTGNTNLKKILKSLAPSYFAASIKCEGTTAIKMDINNAPVGK